MLMKCGRGRGLQMGRRSGRLGMTRLKNIRVLFLMTNSAMVKSSMTAMRLSKR